MLGNNLQFLKKYFAKNQGGAAALKKVKYEKYKKQFESKKSEYIKMLETFKNSYAGLQLAKLNGNKLESVVSPREIYIFLWVKIC